ncbi:sulfite exporter TauE/SafE family protein [Catenovulum maritimum]|uniref:Probable membrane transporter protein n=1 Tax=Catenovulum maritimum TaxID=1513271 RepID=A0A0J8JIL6_9ALTE|nr:sulfite exporter TauE/SafE family protein [Catenovulum maritimum]KMT64301.1 hypothetical protein XM47_14995 [Catenovulum maritimum]
MFISQSWHYFNDFWPMSLTMALGSFVAGSTPTGGAAVAFPVFTKVLDISAADARTFGFMIQSIGMTSAALYIWHRKLPVLKPVILFASLGGIIGNLIAQNGIEIPAGIAKITFTSLLCMFALALLYCTCSTKPKSQYLKLHVTKKSARLEFFIAGVFGGFIAEMTGSGVDIIVFILLTLSYRVSEKISIPTTVICMAINSIYGFITHAFYIQDTAPMFGPWLVSIPIVAIGAPIGAWLVTQISNKSIICLICFLVALDLISSLAILNFNTSMYQTICLSCLVCGSTFYCLIKRTK